MGAKRGRPRPVRSGRKKGTKNGQYTRNKVENPIRTTYEAGVEEGRKLKVGVTPVPKEYVAKDRLLHRIAWVNGVRDGKIEAIREGKVNGDGDKRIDFTAGNGSVRTPVPVVAIGQRAHPALCVGGDGDKSKGGDKGDGGSREDGGKRVGAVVPET